MDSFLGLIEKLKENGIAVLEYEPLSRHTSIRIGGPARCFVQAQDRDTLLYALKLAQGFGLEPVMLGRGSNVVPPDAGLDRLVLQTGGSIRRTGDCTLWADCGVTLSRLALFAQSLGLKGLEFAHGIPGSVGGAVIMNAGAYGGQMGDVITSVEYWDGGEIKSVSGSELDFSYRHSFFSDSDAVVLGAHLALSPGNAEEISAQMEELSRKRRESQPLDIPSAGSAFKRPSGGYAATLIEEAGLKGFSIGGATVSEKHSGFIINSGDATADDVKRLIEYIKATVFNIFGIELEPEIKFIG